MYILKVHYVTKHYNRLNICAIYGYYIQLLTCLLNLLPINFEEIKIILSYLHLTVVNILKMLMKELTLC